MVTPPYLPLHSISLTHTVPSFDFCPHAQQVLHTCRQPQYYHCVYVCAALSVLVRVCVYVWQCVCAVM